MTTRHVVLGLMRHMRARTHQQCEIKLGLPGGCFHRMYRGHGYGLTMMLLDRVQVRSGLSFEQLMTRYREPELIKN